MGQQFTVTLPDAIAESLRAKVLSGEFASVDEAVADALLCQDQMPQQTDAEVEHWLRNEVLGTLRELDADPSAVVTADEVDRRMEAEYHRLLSDR